ncbi:MAG: hypothetical protein K2H90_06745 [Oscillospiraceae bacterium]|nr:hypothetical protein [Oscillospiraceae bacterium]
MTAFDIYSAIGGAGEDILEESEIMPKKKATKIIPLMAAAACFAVVAVGLSRTLRNDDIEKPVADISEITTSFANGNLMTESNLPETGSEISWNDTVTHTVSTSASQTTNEDITVTEHTDPNAPTETYTGVTEETTVCPTDTPIVSMDEDESVIIPKWEDLSDLERYVYLEYAGNEYAITVEKFDKSELTFLRNSEVYGIDEYTDKKYSMECAVYKIENIDPDYMVAVLTADGLYTGFERFPYYADTLADYLADTDFLNRDKIGEKVTIDDDDTYCATVYTLNDLPNAVEKLLTAAPDTPPESDLPWTPNCYFIYSRNGKSFLRVYDNGYVYLCNWYFNIGTENTDAFIEYVKENAVNVEAVPYDIDFGNNLDIPE